MIRISYVKPKARLSTTAGTAVGADETALLVDECLLTADGALLAYSLGTVSDILLQCALHTILPCVDALVFELQRANELDDMVDRHTIAQHAGDQLGIVPVFRIELLAQSFHRGLVATLVLKLEVIAMRTVGVGLLDDLALGDALRQHNAFVVVLQTGEDLVRLTVEQSNEGHPLLTVVLEAHYIAVELLRANLLHRGTRNRGCGNRLR